MLTGKCGGQAGGPRKHLRLLGVRHDKGEVTPGLHPLPCRKPVGPATPISRRHRSWSR